MPDFRIQVQPPDKRPRTRKELLQHLWAIIPDCNIFKEGPFYAVRHGRVIAATHTRCIDSRTFAGWEQFVRSTPKEL